MKTMVTKNDVIAKLKTLGMPDDKVESAVDEVSEILRMRVVAAGLNRLSEEERTTVMAMPPEEAERFFYARKEKIALNQADIERIYEDTWAEYFQALT